MADARGWPERHRPPSGGGDRYSSTWALDAAIPLSTHPASGCCWTMSAFWGDDKAWRNGRDGEGFRTPAIQAAGWHWAGVRKPPMHEPAGRVRCYGDLRNLLFRRGWRDGRCGWRGAPDVPADAGVGRRDRSAGVPSTRRVGAGRSDLTVVRAASDPMIAAGTRSPGGRSTSAWLVGRGLSCRVTTQQLRCGRATVAARAPGRHRRRSR